MEPELSQESDGDKPSTSLSGMLRSQIPRLGRFLRRQCGAVFRTKESVSDVRQSVCREFVERWKRSPSPDRDEGRRWMFRLARKKIVERLRYYGAEKRDPAREVRSPGSPDSGASMSWAVDPRSPTPSAVAIDREHRAQIESDMARLPEDYREIIRLAREEGLSHAEIGRRLGRSEAAARKLLSRALARLATLAKQA